MKIGSLPSAIFGVLLLSCFVCLTDGADILVVCLIASMSHHVVIHPVAVGLADRGHNVTYLASLNLPYQDTRIRYVSSESMVKLMTEMLSNVGDQADRGTDAPNPFTFIYPFVVQLCQIFYSDVKMQEWIQSSTFDLIFMDGVYSECSFGLVHKYKAPFVQLSTASFLPWLKDLLGLPDEGSWLPDMRLNLTHPMGFLDRVMNTVTTLQMYLYHMSFNYYPDLIAVIRKGLADPNIPEISEIYSNVSLIFLNSYFASEYPRSLPPFVIPVGCIHCSTKNSTLPLEVETFISTKAQDGFVFISFGTAFKPTKKTLHDMLEAMKKFDRIGFIFRWFGTSPAERADNVLFVSWVPQQVLLAHPKIRAFVSQCGMASVQEATHYGVPVLAVPGFVDQDFNAECLVRLGAAQRLELSDFDENGFDQALRQLLENPKYKERMQMLRNMYNDRPQKPLETAIWWIEYVLRHAKSGSDLSLMKPLGINQYWWQRKLIDVYVFLFILITLTVGIFSTCLLYLAKKLPSKPQISHNVRKKNN